MTGGDVGNLRIKQSSKSFYTSADKSSVDLTSPSPTATVDSTNNIPDNIINTIVVQGTSSNNINTLSIVNGHLVVNYADGTSYDVGALPGIVPPSIPPIVTAPTDLPSVISTIATLLTLFHSLGLVNYPQPLVISGTPAPTQVSGNATFTPTISGGTSPYNLSVFSGTLPAGRLISGLTVSGSYTTSGTYHYVLRITDSLNQYTDLSVIETVNQIPVIAISGIPLSASVGDTTAFVPIITGGTSQYTLSLFSGSLPTGRSISNGQIIGSYTTAGTYAYVLRVTDSSGQHADLSVSQTVTAAPAALTVTGTPSAVHVGDTLIFSPTISGGTSPYTTVLFSGNLPNGRTITGNTVTGTYSTSGSFAYTLRIFDNAGHHADLIVSETVGAAIIPVSITGSPSSAVTGTSAIFTPTISGGTSPYTISIHSGNLPTGRTIASNTITGTYTTAGTFSYVIRATDSLGAFADLSITETITVQNSGSGGTGTGGTGTGGTGTGTGTGTNTDGAITNDSGGFVINDSGGYVLSDGSNNTSSPGSGTSPTVPSGDIFIDGTGLVALF